MKLLFTSILLLFAFDVVAQSDTASLLSLNENRLEISRLHACILGSWAILNITVSGYLTWKLYDGEPESFHHMNAAFNLVNFVIAWAMLYTVTHSDPAQFDLASTVAKHYTAQKLLMLNIGLDIIYALTGFLLYRHSKVVEKFDFMWSGFGKSLIIQGLFLLLLDTTMSFIHASYNADLQQILKQVMLP
ncbi:MAG: DUF6992 family protein [Saprospiraceae bacterium]